MMENGSTAVVTRLPGQSVTSAEIDSGLNRVFAGVPESELSLLRSRSSNVIIVSPVSGAENCDDLLESIALVLPGRYFVVTVSEDEAPVACSVEAVCFPVSREEHICAEVVRLSGGGGAIERIPSIIRKHLLPGRSSELIAFGDLIQNDILGRFRELADRIFIDSGHQAPEQYLPQLGPSFGRQLELVDLQWLRTAPWRGALGALFELPCVQQELLGVTKIELVYPKPCRVMALLGAWIVERLGGLDLAEKPDNPQELWFRSVALSGGEGCLKLAEPSGGSNELLEVAFFVTARVLKARRVGVRMENMALGVYPDLQGAPLRRFALESDSPAGYLKRYFSEGMVDSEYESLRPKAAQIYAAMTS